MLSGMEKSFYQLAVGVVPPEEAGMLLNLVSEDEKVYFLTGLIKLSEAGFPIVPQNTLTGYRSLELFWNPYKRIGDIFMALASYHTAEEVAGLIEAAAKKNPGFEDEIRPYILCFEEVIYLNDLEMQSVLRREGLNPFILIDTSPELSERLLGNVSLRVKKDSQLRLEELNNVSEIEKIVNSKQALRQKAKFVKAVLAMRDNKEIEGPYVPLTPTEIKLIPQKINELADRIGCLDDDALSLLLNKVIDCGDLAPLYYWGPGEFAERIDGFLTRSMRELLQKNAPKEGQTAVGRKEAEALARLKKVMSAVK